MWHGKKFEKFEKFEKFTKNGRLAMKKCAQTKPIKTQNSKKNFRDIVNR